MACSLESTQIAACLSGIAKEQDLVKLLQLIVELTCEASQSAGGGGNVTKFASANITLTNAATSYTIAHTLGSVPPMVNVVLVCIGGGDIMAVGDESDVSGWFSSANAGPAFQVKRTAASIIVELGDVPLVGNEGNYVVASGGAMVNPSFFNNFALKIYAWL